MKRVRPALTILAALLFLAGMLVLTGCGQNRETPNGSTDYRDAGNTDGSNSPVSEGPPTTGHAFDATHAMQHIEQLSQVIGERPAGSEAESEAAAYIEAAFTGGGYEDVIEQAFPSVGDRISRNIYVEDKGSQPEWVVIVGAHYDSAGGTGSPGANDNASGVGVVLEMARVFRQVENAPTLLFVAFASEEAPEFYDEDEAGYGSDYMAEHLEEIEGEVIGMINLDMVGVGARLDANTTMAAPPVLAYLFAMLAGMVDIEVNMVEETWWSDNVAFEDQGIPTLYLEWVPDYNYHSPRDSFDNVDESLVERTGYLVEGFLGGLDADVCRILARVHD